VRTGYQISVDIKAHHRNMAAHRAPEPVMVLVEILDGDATGWHKTVHQVRCLGPSESQYGWGPERAHARGTRFDAAIWMFTRAAVEYLDTDGVWRTAP
jgi:hypothetical protein